MNRRNYLILFLATLILIIFYFIPTPEGLTYGGKMMLATLTVAVILFISEALPLGVSGLLIMIIPPIFGVISSQDVFRFFGNEAVFFLIGAFMLSVGVQKSGIHKRIANSFLRHFGKSSKRYILGILILGSSLSLIMSEHAVVALLLPIIGISLMNVEKGSNVGKAGMLSLTYGCTAGSVATLLGGARNPYTVAFLQENYNISIDFLEWIKMALPVTLLMIPILWFIIISVHPPENFKIPKFENGKMSKKEWETLLIILFTLSLLLTMRGWGIAISVILGSSLLFIFNIVDWKDVERGMPWGIILLYGGAMTLGKGLQITGASLWLADSVITFTGPNPYLIIFILLVITVVMTEIMSHAAAVALMLPIGAGIASSMNLNVLGVSMAIAMAGGFGYALLIGTPGNIMTYSTGYFRQKDILKTGVIADILGIIIVFLIYMFLWPMMGVVQ